MTCWTSSAEIPSMRPPATQGPRGLRPLFNVGSTGDVRVADQVNTSAPRRVAHRAVGNSSDRRASDGTQALGD